MLSSLADLVARMFGATRRAVGEGARKGGRRLESHLGGQARTEVIVLLAAVLALSSADIATVGASATQLRAALHIDNTDIGLLVAVNAAVAAVFSLPFGYLADRFRRTRMLAVTVFLWGGAMLWSAAAGSFGELLLARLALGVVTAAAGPVVASLIGDYFPSTERGRIYGFVLTGELLGAGIGFAVTGDIAALSWRAAFVILALPTFVLARLLFRLEEPIRGGLAPLLPQPGRGVAAGGVAAGGVAAGGGMAAPAPAPGAAPGVPPASFPPAPSARHESAGDETVVFPAQPGAGSGYPAATGLPYTDPPYTDPSGRLDPRFPAPGYTDPRHGDNTGSYDWRYPLVRGDRSGEFGPVPAPDPAAAAAGPAGAGGVPAGQMAGGGTGGGGTGGGGAAGGAAAAGETEGHADTDAQRLARERGIGPDETAAATLATPMGLVPTVRALLSIRTNTVLIVASALGYFYLAGIETFGIEFTKDQYGISQALANLLLLVVGAGSVVGVLVSGPLSDRMLRGGRLNSRIGTSAVAAAATVVLFVPALLTRSIATALPYLLFAALMLAAQNPPIDAARLDIVPAPLWGRAEGLRTALRTAAQSVAPVAFGGLADLFGGHRSGLEITFLVMLIPLAGNAYVLFRAQRSYPRDVATAGAATAIGGAGGRVAGSGGGGGGGLGGGGGTRGGGTPGGGTWSGGTSAGGTSAAATWGGGGAAGAGASTQGSGSGRRHGRDRRSRGSRSTGRGATPPTPTGAFDQTTAVVPERTSAPQRPAAPGQPATPEQWPEPTERVQGWPEVGETHTGPSWRDADDWDPGWPHSDREGSDRN